MLSLVILKVALPLELVTALYVLPPTFKYTVAFLIALPLLSFRVIVYFLVFVVVLNVFVLAVIFGVAFLTVTLTSLVDSLYLSLPLNIILAV